MRIRVVLTGPPRVVLGRPAVDLVVPGSSCTVEEMLIRLADGEPRLARYLHGADGRPPAFLRPLLDERALEPGAAIPDGAVVTLVYAVAGGSGGVVSRRASARGARRDRSAPVPRRPVGRGLADGRPVAIK